MTTTDKPCADVTSVANDAKELAADAAHVAADPQASLAKVQDRIALSEADIAAKTKLAEAEITANTILAKAKIEAEAEIARAKILAETKAESELRKNDRAKSIWLPIALAAIGIVPVIFSYQAKIEAAASREEAVAAKSASMANGEKMIVVQEKLDGRLTRLLELTEKNSRAEGVTEGRAQRDK